MATAQDDHGLRGYDEAPAFLRQNPSIRSGYRVFYSPKECLRSLFEWNNETVNIWTHISGILLFGGVLVHDVWVRLPTANASPEDSLVLVALVCTYLTTLSLSVLYHTFNCQSEWVYHRLLRYDLCGVGLSICSTFASGVFLAFQNYPDLKNTYFVLELVLFASAVWKRNEYPVTLLCGLGIFGVVPTLHWLYLAPPCMTLILPKVLLLFISSALSFLVLEGRFPERVSPGRFDYVGASHQIWHILVILMTLWWHETALEFVRCKTSIF